jgi:hypothetical protein
MVGRGLQQAMAKVVWKIKLGHEEGRLEASLGRVLENALLEARLQGRSKLRAFEPTYFHGTPRKRH